MEGVRILLHYRTSRKDIIKAFSLKIFLFLSKQHFFGNNKGGDLKKTGVVKSDVGVDQERYFLEYGG